MTMKLRSGSPWRAAAAAMLLILAGCGGGGGGGGAPGDDTVAESGGPGGYYPLGIGNRWYYDDGFSAQVASTRQVDGQVARVVRHFDRLGSAQGETAIVIDNSGVRELSDSADPLSAGIGPLQLLRFPLVAGDNFVQIDKTISLGGDRDGDDRIEQLAVHSVVTVVGFETVATDIGTFNNAAHLRTVLTETIIYTSNGSRETATYTTDEWFAPGIGPVRQTQTIVFGQDTNSSDYKVASYNIAGRRSESVAPTVTSVSPAADSVDNNAGTVLRVEFSEPMDLLTLTPSTVIVLDPAGVPVSGTIAATETSVTFTPNRGWGSGEHSARITTGAADRAGNTLAADRQWRFRLDADAPAVTAVSPANGTQEVSLSPTITLTFSEDIDPASIADLTTPYVPGSINLRWTAVLNGKTLTLTPNQPLPHNTTVQIQICCAADLRGNPMRSYFSSQFTTTAGWFALPTRLPLINTQVNAATAGDVTGDGRPDIVIATGYAPSPSNEYSLLVLAQRADGSLAAPVSYATGSNSLCQVTSLTVVDLDGDGRRDVVLGEGDCGVEIFRQGGDGRLGSGVQLNAGAKRVVVADVNGDSRPDIVAVGSNGGDVSVWRQQAGGAFDPVRTYTLGQFGAEDLAVGDINADGRPDIVIFSVQSDPGKALALLLQQPDGEFAAPLYARAEIGRGGRGLAIGDVDGDGRNDIVVGAGGATIDAIGILHQQPGGTMGPLQAVPTSSSAAAVAVADIDNDGRLDIIVGHNNDNSIGLYRQQPGGGFGGEDLYAAASGALTVIDLNGDGRRDIVAGGAMLLQNPSAATTASAVPRTSARRLAAAARQAAQRQVRTSP